MARLVAFLVMLAAPTVAAACEDPEIEAAYRLLVPSDPTVVFLESQLSEAEAQIEALIQSVQVLTVSNHILRLTRDELMRRLEGAE
jgi:uncharacterized membrane protein YjdF